MKKQTILLVVWTYIATAILLVLLFSPYAKPNDFTQRILIEQVEINAPAEQVFNYLGSSHTATEWSSFVDHITPLNEDIYLDGEKGSKRRCFQNANKSGFRWDEEILLVQKNRKRRLSIYNIQGYSIATENLLTEQIFKKINNNCVQLSLSLFLQPDSRTWLDELKLHYASYTIASIFKENLKNIKRINESYHQ